MAWIKIWAQSISLQITVISVKLLLQIFKTMAKSEFRVLIKQKAVYSPFRMNICQWESCVQSGCSIYSQSIKNNNVAMIQSIVCNCFKQQRVFV